MDTFIRYLRRPQIDAIKWDRCLENSANGLIYARSEYLDGMTDNWNGLVVGDYDAVMPLPWRSKWGLSYYYHPAFIQQLGLFGRIDPELYREIFKMVFASIRYGDLLLNFSNRDLGKQIGATPCNNLVLDLSGGYAPLAAAYKTDLVNNLRKASKHSLHYVPDDDVSNAIAVYERYYAQRISSLGKNDYQRFLRLCRTLQEKNCAIVRKVVDDSGALLSVALLLKDDRRMYNMMNTTTGEGRTVAANHFLLDNVIREFAGAQMVLDMEGSDLPGVKHFYLNFGAREQPYFKYSRLPFVVKFWRKRR